ncbi:MAG: hypothetical protein ACYCZR_08570 [Burkholderiales bacterium]
MNEADMSQRKGNYPVVRVIERVIAFRGLSRDRVLRQKDLAREADVVKDGGFKDEVQF